MQLSDTSDIHALTARLGLTLNESEVYFFLLQRGLTSGPEIYQLMNMDKSSCYRALNSLQQKHLVYKIGEERNQQFGANPVDRLEQMAEKKQAELDKTKKQLSEMIDDFHTFAKNNYLSKNVAIIEGAEGHKQMLEDRLSCKEKLIRDISSRDSAEQFFENYDEHMKDYIARRAKKGIFLRQLTDSGGIDDKWERSDEKMKKEVRELQNDFKLNAVFGTWDDKTSLYSKKTKGVMGVIIKDSLITNLMNAMFDSIWSAASDQ